VDEALFKKNGSVCPFNYFDYIDQDISTFKTTEADTNPKNSNQAEGDPYHVGTKTYTEFKEDETFVTNTAERNKEPIVNFFIGPNRPCFAADEPHLVDRSGLDKTFMEPNCDSSFKGSK